MGVANLIYSAGQGLNTFDCVSCFKWVGFRLFLNDFLNNDYVLQGDFEKATKVAYEISNLLKNPESSDC